MFELYWGTEILEGVAMSEHEHACEVCGNWPDEEGLLEHGRGCYKVNDDGGGCEYIEEADRSRHTDHLAGGEASGCELPTGPGLWTRGADEWAWVIRGSGGDLFADAWHIPSEKRAVYLGTRWSDLPRGNWHPAPSPSDDAAEVARILTAEVLDERDKEIADLRAEVERLRGIIYRCSFAVLGEDLAKTVVCLTDELPEHVEDLKAENTNLTAKLAAVERERDEANEKLRQWFNASVDELARRTETFTALQSERDALADQNRRLREALTNAWDRMDRARAILFKPEIANWGILDTTLDRAALESKGAAADGQ